MNFKVGDRVKTNSKAFYMPHHSGTIMNIGRDNYILIKLDKNEELQNYYASKLELESISLIRSYFGL